MALLIGVSIGIGVPGGTCCSSRMADSIWAFKASIAPISYGEGDREGFDVVWTVFLGAVAIPLELGLGNLGVSLGLELGLGL